MARQHTTLDAVTIDGESIEMLQAEFGMPRGVTWQKYDICSICGFVFPRSQIVYIKGVPYCTKFKDYRDAPGTGGIKEGR